MSGNDVDPLVLFSLSGFLVRFVYDILFFVCFFPSILCFFLSICRVLFFSGKSLGLYRWKTQNTFLLLFIGSAGRSSALKHDLFISFFIL